MKKIGIMIILGCALVGCTQQPKEVATATTQPVVTAQPTATPEVIVEKQHTEFAKETIDDKQLVLSIDGYGSKAALNDKELTLIDMLHYAVADEYAAHGEYEAIMEKYGVVKPYSNISKSEVQHLSLLKSLFDAYGLDFLEDESKEHVVVPSSLEEAAKIGVQAEIDNIAMYEKFLEQDIPDSAREVFTALRDASKSHLLAFQKQIKS